MYFQKILKGSYLGHCHPPHALVLVDVLNNAFMHEQDVWSTRHIRMDSHRENKLVYEGNPSAGSPIEHKLTPLTVFSIEVVKMVFPDVLNVPMKV